MEYNQLFKILLNDNHIEQSSRERIITQNKQEIEKILVKKWYLHQAIKGTQICPLYAIPSKKA